MNEEIIIIKAGTTPIFEFEVNKDGTNFPLEGITITFVLARFGNNIPILTKTTSDFIVVENKATLILSEEETSDLSGEYIYQIFYKDAMNNVDRVDSRVSATAKIQ